MTIDHINQCLLLKYLAKAVNVAKFLNHFTQVCTKWTSAVNVQKL